MSTILRIHVDKFYVNLKWSFLEHERKNNSVC